ncbi:hypothetical protein BH23BAC1_BH23BAC1_12980 [soil metagenome]
MIIVSRTYYIISKAGYQAERLQPGLAERNKLPVPKI